MRSGDRMVIRQEPSISAPTIDLLSLAIAQANGSLVLATADEERPHTNRPSWPSTTWIASMSRRRGGLDVVCLPVWWALLPKTIALPFPVQVPLRSGTASCTYAGVETA